MIARVVRSGDATPAGLPGVGLVVATGWSVGGPIGLAAGLVAAVAWLLLPTHYAVGAAVVLLAAVAPPATPLAWLAPAAVGVGWMGLAPAVGGPDARTVVVGGALAVAVGLALATGLEPTGIGPAALAAAAVLVGLPVGSLALDALVARIDGGGPG